MAFIHQNIFFSDPCMQKKDDKKYHAIEKTLYFMHIKVIHGVETEVTNCKLLQNIKGGEIDQSGIHI